MSFALRVACEDDIPAIEALIPLSVRALQAAHYSEIQMAAALGPVFGVDRELIRDGTYFVAGSGSDVVGCGGWSRRRTLFGGDHGRSDVASPPLDPHRDAARIRAFFVHPDWARRGIGRRIMQTCEAAIAAAGFRTVELVATLAGEPLYASFAYQPIERLEIPLTGDLHLPVVRMTKSLAAGAS